MISIKPSNIICKSNHVRFFDKYKLRNLICKDDNIEFFNKYDIK